MALGFHQSLIVALTGMTFLAGCEQGALPFLNGSGKAANEAPAEGGPAAATIVEKDVEAPDVFAANEPGLWDGRPSLGGVWVAHPDLADPERVLIKNEANGTEVVGAIFRRERDNPGPQFQVSSDAAEALGMLAGQPTVLDVVVLRREEVEVPAAAPPVDGETVDLAEATGADIEASSLDDADPVAAAGAAIAAAESGSQGQPLVIEPAGLRPMPNAPELDLPLPEKNASAAPVAAAPVAPTAASKLDKPYIQIGIFSEANNAENTAESLRGVGVIPTVRAQESSGKKFWRVIVGPATNESDRSDVLEKVRGLGFEDAYYVTN